MAASTWALWMAHQTLSAHRLPLLTSRRSLTEQLKIAQTAQDDNTAEYLKLANSTDEQQAVCIKLVFEKKNQKSEGLKDVGTKVTGFSEGVVNV